MPGLRLPDVANKTTGRRVTSEFHVSNENLFSLSHGTFLVYLWDFLLLLLPLMCNSNVTKRLVVIDLGILPRPAEKGVEETGLGTHAWKMSATREGRSSDEKAEAPLPSSTPRRQPAPTPLLVLPGRDWPRSTRALVSSHPPRHAPWCRPIGPSITLRSASASIDSLLHSPPWTAAERRAAGTVVRSRDEGQKAAPV